jgi:ferrous iron transport protein B
LATLRIALAGNPNVGKSALFNALTGLQQKVANYPGVTVERREGFLRPAFGFHGSVVDLPGIQSLVPRAPDEEIAAKVLTGAVPGMSRPDVAVLVMDACQVRRGLFLLSQIAECGLPVVVCLNMADEARRDGLHRDPSVLSMALGNVPVVTTVGTTGEGVADLVRACGAAAQGRVLVPPPAMPGLQGLPPPSGPRWAAVRDAVTSAGLEEVEVQARWRWVGTILERLRLGQALRRRARSDRVDRLLLHPLFGPLAFVAVMGAVFQAVFKLAAWPMEGIEAGFGFLGSVLQSRLGAGLFSDFLAEGVLAGVGSVVVFLPQILILFFFLGLLEDTGYMTRAAFIVDRPLRAVGLSGRAFIPLLSSFACAVPGILATRCIEDRRERLLTILVAPLMTCSARLPVYSVLIGAFVPEQTVLGFLGLQGLVLLGLYLFGLLLAAAAALLADRLLSRSGGTAQVMEMAPYRMPSLRSLLLRLWHRARQFLIRAGTVILAVSILLWGLLKFPNFDRPAGMGEETFRAQSMERSYGGRLGHALEPLVSPLGYDWRIAVGLIGSFAAREVFVSTMSVVYAVERSGDGDAADAGLMTALRMARDDRTDAPVYTLGTVLSLLVFYAVALQCMSTVAVIYRETLSLRWTALQLLGLTSLAWLLAFVTKCIVRT